MKKKPATSAEHDRLMLFSKTTEQMAKIYEQKNHDYGNSFAKARHEIPNYTLGKLYDKVSRLISLMGRGEKAKVSDESIEDTLLDLANYAVMELVERRVDRDDAMGFVEF